MSCLITNFIFVLILSLSLISLLALESAIISVLFFFIILLFYSTHPFTILTLLPLSLLIATFISVFIHSSFLHLQTNVPCILKALDAKLLIVGNTAFEWTRAAAASGWDHPLSLTYSLSFYPSLSVTITVFPSFSLFLFHSLYLSFSFHSLPLSLSLSLFLFLFLSHSSLIIYVLSTIFLCLVSQQFCISFSLLFLSLPSR